VSILFQASFGASHGAIFSGEVHSLVSNYFPRTVGIGREFPQFAEKAAAFLTEEVALSIKDAKSCGIYLPLIAANG
jgi:hypothetical protein